MDFMTEEKPKTTVPVKPDNVPADANKVEVELPEEMDGSDKPEPTRYGDWEVDGRCTDF